MKPVIGPLPNRPCEQQNYWPANRAIIHSRWPDLLAPIEMVTTDLPPHELIEAREKTLNIDGLQLTSKYDRQAEANLQASLIPESSHRAAVYGLALGDLPRVLLERPALQELTVTILNPAVAYLSFSYFDHSDWLSNPRVTLALPNVEQAPTPPFAAAPACLLLADGQAAALRDRILLELATPYIRRKHQSSPELLQRLEQNSRFVATDRDVGELFGTQVEQTLVVAAAGPTLSDHYNWLAAKDRPPLIAVDAALKPLLHAGIVPDFVVSIDAHQNLYRLFFKGLDPSILKHIPLVYFPVIASDILSHWPGPRFTSYPDTHLYTQLASRFPKAKLFSSGSVLHPAVDLAVCMGANKVILAGADLSYPNGQSHVSGCSVLSLPSGTGRHWVLNGYGEKVATTPNMRGYLRDLENYLVRHEETTFINASNKGAAIRHTSFLEELP